MNKLIILCALMTATAFGQIGVRYDSSVTTTSSNVPPGASAAIMTLPNAIVTVCGFPATPAFGAPCTNTVPIFSDSGLTVAIDNPLTADQKGRFGFWLTPAQLSYSVQNQAGAYVGTFPLSLNSPPGPQGPGGIGCGTGNCIVGAPTVTQAINQPTGTSMNVNSLNGVLNATMFSGADAGAKINAAYAALPASGGMIIYPVANGGESFSTPIVFGVATKTVILSCSGANGMQGDVLTYTGSGTAITFDNGPQAFPAGPIGTGIRDCFFTASNLASSTLLFLGGTNGAEGASITNSKFTGGGLTVGLGDNTWDVKFDNDVINSGTQLFVTSGSTNAGENIQLDHVVFGNSQVFTNAVIFGGGASGPGLNLQCNACSFDNAQLVVSGGEIEINSTHFEDPGNIVWSAPPLLVNGGNVALNTATFFGDHSTSTPLLSSYISVTSGMLITDALDTFGCNCTNIYVSSGTGKIVGHTPLTLAGGGTPPGSAVISLIADTSSEPSTVDGGRDFAFHAESPYAIQGYMSFLPGGGIHVRDNGTQQAGTGNYVHASDFMSVTTPDTAGYTHAKWIGRNCDNVAYSSSIDFYTEKKTVANQTDTSTVAATLDCNKVFNVPAVVSTGPIFSVSGCSATTPIGGATTGQFNAGIAGTCTVTITMGNSIAAPNGWTCSRPTDISDPTKSGSWFETAFTQTTVTLAGTSGVGELIQFSCIGY